MNGYYNQQQQHHNFQNNDTTTTIVEQFLSKLLESLDQQISNPQSILNILPQLHQNPRIIINGNPFGSKEQFQQLWSKLPSSNHQVTSCDIHFLPNDLNNNNSNNHNNNNNNGQYIILAHLKVRFDESGKNKMGETGSFNNSSNFSSTRNIWSHWFGVSLSLVVDSTIINNPNAESISIWDYRFTENPSNSIFKVN